MPSSRSPKYWSSVQTVPLRGPAPPQAAAYLTLPRQRLVCHARYSPFVRARSTIFGISRLVVHQKVELQNEPSGQGAGAALDQQLKNLIVERLHPLPAHDLLRLVDRWKRAPRNERHGHGRVWKYLCERCREPVEGLHQL